MGHSSVILCHTLYLQVQVHFIWNGLKIMKFHMDRCCYSFNNEEIQAYEAINIEICFKHRVLLLGGDALVLAKICELWYWICRSTSILKNCLQAGCEIGHTSIWNGKNLMNRTAQKHGKPVRFSSQFQRAYPFGHCTLNVSITVHV